ncbi:hypothetical protein [Microcoleus sp. herbarium14]|uniref:hypothetical protein n=1 Tax=Microcoleus sp. herbarium14 TaxID=3055439 RepID=UPI002FD60B79
MDNSILEQIKSKYRLGQFVQGKVKYHAPFGVFVDLGDVTVKGLIKIPVPTINRGRETALPYPLYYSGATGIDIIPHLLPPKYLQNSPYSALF